MHLLTLSYFVQVLFAEVILESRESEQATFLVLRLRSGELALDSG